jgi:cell division septation protein DedD
MLARAVLLAGLLPVGPALARDPVQPAELPPADYAGQQYVDSKGCLFVRAGTEGQVLWIPRVSRQGVPDCSHPPSGRRVPVAEEIGVQAVPKGDAAAAEATSEVTPGALADGIAPATTGGVFVAVGSFGVAANADRAEAELARLNYAVVRGRVDSANGTLTTVFAGPFADTATATGVRDVLRADGFPDASLIRP